MKAPVVPCVVAPQRAQQIVVVGEEPPRRPSHMDRRTDLHRTQVPVVPVCERVAGIVLVVVDVARALARIGNPHSHSHLRTRNHRPSSIPASQHSRHIQVEMVEVGDFAVACVLCGQMFGNGRRDRTVALSMADRTYTDPAHRHPVPTRHPVVAHREVPVKSLSSVDFDCIHLLMSQRPNPLSPGDGELVADSWFVNHSGYRQFGYPL